jgi:acyl carrier protein
MAQSVKDRVIAIIAEQAMLDPADVRPESTLESLGIDSLGLVESIFAIEEASTFRCRSTPTTRESDFDISSVAAIDRGGRGAGGRPRRMNRVVITGAGTINALAHDAPGTLEAFREGRCGITELDIRDKDRLSIQIGGQVHNWDPEAHFNRQQIVLYDKFTQFTLLAARQAVAQSGPEL